MERTSITLRRLVNVATQLLDWSGSYNREQKQKITTATSLLTEVLDERSEE